MYLFHCFKTMEEMGDPKRSHGPTVSSLKFQAMRGAEQQLRAAEVQPGPGDLEVMAISWPFHGDFMGILW